jgi:hypothetical protein
MPNKMNDCGEKKLPGKWPAIAWGLGALVWLVLVAGGTCLMLDYSESAGVAAKAPIRWPAASHLTPNDGRPTLLMFVHPHCPCSRASVGELDRLVAHGKDRVSVHVLFIKPHGMSEDWLKSPLYKQAAAIPGVQVKVDDEGVEAARFNAATSGQALLYDAKGELLFEGGITPARGHAGDSAGRAAILDFLAGEVAGKYETPVFGCELCESGGKRS